MSIARESIMTALFGLLSKCAPFQTTGRRVPLWSTVTAQPALFLRDMGEEYPHPDVRGLGRKVTIHAEVWIYSKTIGPTTAPIIQLNNLIGAVEDAIAPSIGQDTQTLGGLVSHCWIEGEVKKYSGDLDDQAIAYIPVKILVPA